MLEMKNGKEREVRERSLQEPKHGIMTSQNHKVRTGSPALVSRILTRLVLSCLCLASCEIVAESFLGPTTANNRLLIATNEAVVIDGLAYDSGGIPGDLACAIIVDNTRYKATLSSTAIWNHSGGGNYAFSGPAEIVFDEACVVHMTRLTNAAIHTILWPANNKDAISVSVPEGKTIKFFLKLCPQGGFDAMRASLKRGPRIIPTSLWPLQPLEGPWTMDFMPTENYGGEAEAVAFVSYWIIEDVFQGPNGPLPSIGGTSIMVEKSADLNSWSAVGTLVRPPEATSFYRLRIAR